ncbi:MAG: hypothetical protein HFI06_02155 [Eubacterium sp.]|jgi:hypothetical protein|nr:hypothetical protein [Eubacterium sp.]
MFHVFIRVIIAVMWLAAAYVSGVLGNNITLAIIYIIPGGAFLYSAYVTWKNGRPRKR